MPKRILIIAYQFPPMGGVGTRRWAKFAKYLRRNGHEVHVLHARYDYVDQPNWSTDVAGVPSHSFRSFFPSFFLRNLSPSSPAYPLQRYGRFLLLNTLFPFDVAQHDARPLLKKAKELIARYDLRNVIATGHPLSINYFASFLKADLPGINLIEDFRDNWNDLPVYRYPGGIRTFRGKVRSVEKECRTLYYADWILNVTEDLSRRMRQVHRSHVDRILTLHNGYDPEDYPERKSSGEEEGTFVYAGSLFNRRIEAVYLLLDAVAELEKKGKLPLGRFRLHLYTNFPADSLAPDYRKYLGERLFIHEMVSPSELPGMLSRYRYALSINARNAPYAFGTKIFDYMALGMPILHISQGGELSECLERAGEAVSSYERTDLQKALLDLQQRPAERRTDYSEFSLPKLTEKLERILV